MEDPEINRTELIQQIALLESIAKKNMAKESISRYGNLKIAHPELALKVISAIAQAAQFGQIKKPLTDEEFKGILLEIQQGKRTLKFKS